MSCEVGGGFGEIQALYELVKAYPIIQVVILDLIVVLAVMPVDAC